MESTMFVLPEPLGPTIAVTPPSKRISVDRAKVLNPNRLSDCRNKGRFTVADWGPREISAQPPISWGSLVANRLLPTTPGFYSIGAPNWRLRGGSAAGSSGAPSPTGFGSVSGTRASATSGSAAVVGSPSVTGASPWGGRLGPRRARVRAARGGFTAEEGLAAPTRLSSAALAASCSASCLVAPCPVPRGSAPANTTDVYSRCVPTLAPSLS